MKMKDVKLLWGRSGNRCAFPGCKIELTPDGSKSTLGEMAHIVADSPDGPRGESDLTPEERDEYSNLILLCPTHHTLIDKNPEEWTVEKLKLMKLEHEQWVTNKLEQDKIYINQIDNSDFIESREKEWKKFAGTKVWVIVSLTPLNISDDSIDPLNRELLTLINSCRLPDFYDMHSPLSSFINSYNTRPNEYGVVNEDLSYISQGFGYKIMVSRNGHCEFMLCLEGFVQEDTKSGQTRSFMPDPHNRVLRYEDVAKSFRNQIHNLIEIWSLSLPFNDTLLTAMITNTSSTNLLYTGRQLWTGYAFSSPVHSPNLNHKKVINKNEKALDLSEYFIKRFVNYYGLTIDRIFNEDGTLALPRRLSC
ncbi:HNH endonuclease [Coleofasciculus sp.]|uniref:HNH endonuclease n=1 Tax=Coleofasciculus sp. TaxID=3100458 RepID=UPI0039F7E381